MHWKSGWGRARIITLMLVGATHPLMAQAFVQTDTSMARCLAAIPATSLHEVRVFVVETFDESLSPGKDAVADPFAKSLTAKLREILGAAPNKVPAAEPRITWRDLGGSARATVFRGGRATLADDLGGPVSEAWPYDVSPEDSSSRPPRTNSILLVANAFESLMKDPAYQTSWPQGLSADSVTFRLFFHVAEMDSLGYIEPSTYRIMFPAFKLLVPTITPVRAKSPITLSYPSTAFRNSTEGSATLFFFVDKNGRVRPESIRDGWPATRPKQPGALGKSYDAFVKAGREAVLAAQFIPATIGGCPVPQRVVQPLQFVLR